MFLDRTNQGHQERPQSAQCWGGSKSAEPTQRWIRRVCFNDRVVQWEVLRFTETTQWHHPHRVQNPSRSRRLLHRRMPSNPRQHNRRSPASDQGRAPKLDCRSHSAQQRQLPFASDFYNESMPPTSIKRCVFEKMDGLINCILWFGWCRETQENGRTARKLTIGRE